MRLTFYGGAKTITGANYILEAGNGEKIMIDCGLLQGGHYAENKNFEDFPYNPEEIGAVFVTHAHIDHIGRLPKLISNGFKGTVYSTEPTKAFAKSLLEDSVDILAREAKRYGKPGFCRQGDIKKLMNQWQEVVYHQKITHGPFLVTFYDAGHILGSAFIKIEADGKSVVFSGDLGNSPAPLIKERELIPTDIDYVFMESAYGGEKHEPREGVMDKLEDIIEATVKRNGVLLIPAFAMERTQILLHHIHDLMSSKKIPKALVFLDSPLAIRVTEVYKTFADVLDRETQKFLREGHNLFEFPNLYRTETTEESKAIWKKESPKIIIAGAGMSQGGRILHHEKRYLPDSKNAIVFVGYQVKGSLGRKILDGAKKVKINGDEIPVRAQVFRISEYSSHADQPQLLEWLKPARFDLKKVFLIQGEEAQMEILSSKIQDRLAVDVEIPGEGDSVSL